MKIFWEVNDGYAGGSRPHETVIDDGDLAACLTEHEREELIQDLVQEDFESKISRSEKRREE